MNDDLSPDTILERALEMDDPQARAAWLDEACGGDEALRGEVGSLLAACEAADADFMDTLVDPVWSEIKGEQEGDTIGRYKLLEQIGEGGFGTVYLAEQSEPVKRRVALKVIKAGMDSKEVIARFEAERQALALMDHPHIAKVHDAGTTDGGRPYFVMELVKGVPITNYCNDHDLDTKARLELFTDVCAAVQHAHQKGVIHRDLKPGNIMVSPHDGKPVVKVIDFGIAKAISMELTEKAVFTQLGRMIGTPQYMSPEQAELNALDVDTRSDIYSLGVVLYELLTGTTPLDGEQLRSAAYGEMQRLIREETPPKPSTKLASSISRPRSSHPFHLAISPRHLRGDLDWIVMKALEKERSRRYETANGLAMDLQRFLRQEPVVAGPPGIAYKMGKFVRRHRTTVAVAVTITFLLVAGIFGTSWFALSAQKAKEEAFERTGEVEEALESFRYAEARALLGRARLLVLENKDFEAALLAAKALGFRGFGAERQPAEFAKTYPALLTRDKPEFDPLVTIATRAGAATRPVWRSPAGRRPTGVIRAVACSPDGTILACGRDDQGIQLWSIASGTELRTVEGHSGPVASVAFSPDGATLASGSEDKTVKLWNVSTGDEIRSLEGHQDAVSSVAFSPDGTILASGSHDNVVRLWNVSTGTRIHSLEGHLDQVLNVAFSPDGKTVVGGSRDGMLRFWSVFTGEEIRTVEGGQGAVMALAWSPDGKAIATGGENKTVKLWNASPTFEIQTLGLHQDSVRSVAFSPDGATIVSGAEDMKMKFWDVATRKESQSMEGHQGAVTSVAFSPDGSSLVSGSSDSTIRIWSVFLPRIPKTLMKSRNGHPVRTVALNPRGTLVAVGADDMTITLLDASNGRRVRSWRGHEGELRSVAFSPDGRILASGGRDARIKLWNVATGKEIQSLRGHQYIDSLAFSPDGTILASGSWDRTIKLWNVSSGQEVRTLGGHLRGVTTVAFSPDGTMLASGGWDQAVKIWNVSTGQVIRSLEGHSETIFGVAFGPDGTTVASGSADGTIRLWNVSTGKELHTLETHRNKSWPRTIVFSPDGETLASGTEGIGNNSVVIWNTSTGREVETLSNEFYGGVACLSYNGDGTALVSGSFDGSVKLWQTDYSPIDLAGYADSRHPWCRIESSHIAWTAPVPDSAGDRKFEFLNVPPSTHLGVLRSTGSESERNTGLFWCHVRAGDWPNAFAVFPKLTSPSDRRGAMAAILQLQPSMTPVMAGRWKSVLDPAREVLVRELADSSRKKLEGGLPEEAMHDLTEALSLVVDDGDTTEVQELRRSREALKRLLGRETPEERWANLPGRLGKLPLDTRLSTWLRLHHSFDRNNGRRIRDASGHGRDARAAGGQWAMDPEAGGCYKFTEGGGQITSDGYMGIMGAEPWTVALWYRNSKTSVGAPARLIRWGSREAGEQFCLRLEARKGLVADIMRGHKTSVGRLRELQNGEWHHLAVTFPKGGRLEDLKLYIDGQFVAETSHSHAKRHRDHLARAPLDTTSAMPLTIGSDRLDGLIDEVMIWGRALGPREINQLYHETGGLGMAPVVGRWNWGNGATIVIRSDGTTLNETEGGTGTWEFDENHTLVIRWDDGKWIDTMVLASNFRLLYGTNQNGGQISGVRAPGSIQDCGVPLSSPQLLARAALLIWFGQTAEHTAQCERVLAQAAGTEDALLAATVARISCLQEIDHPGMRDRVLALARRAVNLDPSAHGFRMSLGMAEYRSGNYAVVEKVLAKMIQEEREALAGTVRSHLTNTASYYLAMALLRQGEGTKARSLFAATEARMKVLPANEWDPLAGGATHDDLILWLAYREAAALLAIPKPNENMPGGGGEEPMNKPAALDGQ